MGESVRALPASVGMSSCSSASEARLPNRLLHCGAASFLVPDCVYWDETRADLSDVASLAP